MSLNCLEIYLKCVLIARVQGHRERGSGVDKPPGQGFVKGPEQLQFGLVPYLKVCIYIEMTDLSKI